MTQEEIKNRSLELYPIKPYPIQCKDFNRVETIDLNQIAREAYLRGYEDALKDDMDSFKEAYNNGYNKAVKDLVDKLPKWTKAECDINDDSLDYAVHYKHYNDDGPDWESIVITNRVKEGEYYIDITDLDLLEREQ